MAIKPKGKKVTGTNKNDKITWANTSLWKKSLTVHGLAGNDVINFKKSKYKNSLYGDAGKDKIYGGKKVDKIFGGAGNDKMYGYNGNDIIKAGAGNDFVDGGADNDKIYGESGKNTLKGGLGNDSIYAGNGTDYIWGGAGNDYIDLTKGGVNTVYAEDGDDVINFQYSNNYIDGGNGNDLIKGFAGSNTIKGGAGNDSIIAGIGGTFNVDGGAGNDYIDCTSANITVLNGGAGDDTIYGCPYGDTIDGGDGNDLISGGGGVNILNGGAGNDRFNISDGTNTINAGTGENEIHFSNLISANNTVLKGGGEDTLFLDNQTTFEGLYVCYQGNNLFVNNFGGIILEDFKNGHSVKYVSINGDKRDISGLIGTDINIVEFISGSINVTGSNQALIGGSGADTINIIGTNNVLIGGDGGDTYGFEWGYWNTELTSDDIEHNTIVMGSDNVQDTIYIHTNQDSAGILCRKSGDDMVVWYKRQYYSGENPDADLYDGIYKIGEQDTYVYGGSRYYGSITLKDYFTTANPTINNIVMEMPENEIHREYSILSLFQAPQVDLDNCYNELDEYIGLSEDAMGTYDAENKTYTGTEYNEYIYTRRGIGDGNVVYAGAGNDTIYTWGRTDSVYGEAGNDTIFGNSTCQILDGGEGNDDIQVQASSGSNPQYYVKIFGGEGSDNITVAKGRVKIYTNSETGGKDTTAGVVDRITINTNAYNSPTDIYAQSETNIIVNNNDFGDDNYFAYIDQKTFITEAHGADEDSLTILDAAHTNLHIAFNVRSYAGDVEDDSYWILDDTNYAKWLADMNDETLVGINIKGDSIQKIEEVKANDGYYLTSYELGALQSKVVNWLNTYGEGYYVSDAFASENKDTLIALIASNTNWQAPQ